MILATYGYGTGGAICTQGYGSWEFITAIDFYDERFYIVQTDDEEFQINRFEDRDFYITTASDEDFNIFRTRDRRFYIKRTDDEDFEG